MDRFTETRSGGGQAAAQARRWRHTARSAQRPSGTMRPLLSATGMKPPGRVMPSHGCAQRSSASAPTMLPSVMSTFGWKWTSNSSRSRPARISDSSRRRPCASTFMPSS